VAITPQYDPAFPTVTTLPLTTQVEPTTAVKVTAPVPAPPEEVKVTVPRYGEVVEDAEITKVG
jgi:hypothetical protein